MRLGFRAVFSPPGCNRSSVAKLAEELRPQLGAVPEGRRARGKKDSETGLDFLAARTTYAAIANDYDSPVGLHSFEAAMSVRSFLIPTMMLMALCGALAQTNTHELAFGQVFGSAGFLNPKNSGAMTDAPQVVLVFTSADGHQNLVLTQQTGDYIALLEKGRYCITAYTRAGKGLSLAQNQLKCVQVEPRRDVRLDVMLLLERK